MRTALLLAVVLSALLATVGPAMGQTSTSDVTTNTDASNTPYVVTITGTTIPDTLLPGSDGFIKITITNYGSTHIGSVYVGFDPVESPIRIGSTTELGKDITMTENHQGPIIIRTDTMYNVTYLGGVPGQGSIERIFRISVPPNAPSGIYPIKFMFYGSQAEVSEHTIVKYVLVKVTEPQPLKIETSGSSFRAGETATMNITLINRGTSKLRNLEIAWESPGDEILPVGTDNHISVASLYPGITQEVPVHVYVNPGISVGLHPLHITTTYYDTTGMVQTLNSTIGITVGGASPARVSIDSFLPESFRAGERSNAEITISNTGSEIIRDIGITWSTPNKEILPLAQDNELNLPSIDAYQKVKVPVSLAVSPIVAPGIIPVSIEVTYFDVSGTQHSDNLTVGVAIGGGTDFSVSLQSVSASPSEAAAGSGSTGVGFRSAQNMISLSIANIGVNPAASIVVKIPSQATFTSVGSSEVSLGNLNAGDFTVAQFQITPTTAQSPPNTTAAAGAGGRYLRPAKTEGDLTVIISYTDTDGNRNDVEKKVSLSLGQADPTATASQRGRSSSLQGPLMYGALGIVGITLVWTGKRHKGKLLSLGGLLKSKIIARLPKRGSR